MENKLRIASEPSRRSFLKQTAVLSLVAVSGGSHLFADTPAASKRILVGSGTPDGILSFAWDAKTGELKPEGVAAKISHSTWLDFSPDRRYLYVASEVDQFEGQPSGAVGSFAFSAGKFSPISLVPSHGGGTCHLAIDKTGRVVLCANYSGGSASSFLPKNGNLGQAVWTEHYKGYAGLDGKGGAGPVPDRQEAAHAHFASFSPNNRYAYVNDLGADKIHIYRLDSSTGVLTPAGAYHAKPGDGPRTLHFLAESSPATGPASSKIAYCVNELNSTVTVLSWNASDGSLTPIQTVPLLPEGTATKHGSVTNTGCDAVLTRDGRFAYFANRGDDFLIGFHIDPATGKLTPFAGNPRTSCGGKTPRNFRLDPTERWMLVANQSSSNLSVFARDPKTGQLSNDGKNYPAATPMCIVFV
jgi:6-phosphogluconolactonase